MPLKLPSLNLPFKKSKKLEAQPTEVEQRQQEQGTQMAQLQMHQQLTNKKKRHEEKRKRADDAQKIEAQKLRQQLQKQRQLALERTEQDMRRLEERMIQNRCRLERKRKECVEREQEFRIELEASEDLIVTFRTSKTWTADWTNSRANGMDKLSYVDPERGQQEPFNDWLSEPQPSTSKATHSADSARYGRHNR
jgi:hypothetical protein